MKQPLWVLVLILCIEVMVVLVFIPGNITENIIKKEAAMIDSTMGVETRNMIHLKAQNWYRASVIDSGFYEEMHHLFIPTQEQRAKGPGMKDFGTKYFVWIENRLEALTTVFYQFFTRLALFSIWMPYMMIMLLPAMYDGYMTWKIKCTNFDYVSPVLHQASARGAILLVFIVLISFFFPFVVPPLLMPILMILMCILIGIGISNLQKRF